MLVDAVTIAGGLFVTIFLGWFSGLFLRRSVSLSLPKEFEHFSDSLARGGGPQTGFLERVLFFAAFWAKEPLLIAAWLAFKVASKWAAWQHIVKIPEAVKYATEQDYLRHKSILSSHLLSRFLNGTLYNVICAMIGWTVGKYLVHLFMV